jgi:hypothetical protein
MLRGKTCLPARRGRTVITVVACVIGAVYIAVGVVGGVVAVVPLESTAQTVRATLSVSDPPLHFGGAAQVAPEWCPSVGATTPGGIPLLLHYTARAARAKFEKQWTEAGLMVSLSWVVLVMLICSTCRCATTMTHSSFALCAILIQTCTIACSPCWREQKRPTCSDMWWCCTVEGNCHGAYLCALC